LCLSETRAYGNRGFSFKNERLMIVIFIGSLWDGVLSPSLKVLRWVWFMIEGWWS